MGPELDALLAALGRLPGVGPRSARRLALHLIQNRQRVMEPLMAALADAAATLTQCRLCGQVTSIDPCRLCTDPGRDHGQICVVERLGDLWAIERAGIYRGRYHVLGGVLSAIDGVGPAQLRIDQLRERVAAEQVGEVILALSATVDGQTTAHYLTGLLAGTGARLTRLARGLPVGGSLDYLDDGTLLTAFSGRAAVEP